MTAPTKRQANRRVSAGREPRVRPHPIEGEHDVKVVDLGGKADPAHRDDGSNARCDHYQGPDGELMAMGSCGATRPRILKKRAAIKGLRVL